MVSLCSRGATLISRTSECVEISEEMNDFWHLFVWVIPKCVFVHTDLNKCLPQNIILFISNGAEPCGWEFCVTPGIQATKAVWP